MNRGQDVIKLWQKVYQCIFHCMQVHRKFLFRNVLIFLGTFLLFLLNQYWLKTWLPGGFVHDHLNDVLVMGVFLPYTNALLCLYDRKDVRMRSLPVLFAFTLAVGVFWEFIAPFYTTATSDWYDLLAYLTGAVLYYGGIYRV